MSNVRLRRLQADHDNLVEYIRRHPRLRLIQAAGEPPEQYQIEYRIRSLRQVGDDLQQVKSHMVEISLPRNYPRTPPQCRMLTPVFHPNIAPHAICVGDHWSAGEPLKSIVARIGEMLAYQSYNVKSPLNGEAARWVEQHVDELPLDKVSLLVEEVDAKDDGDEEEAPRPVRPTRPAPQSESAARSDSAARPDGAARSDVAARSETAARPEPVRRPAPKPEAAARPAPEPSFDPDEKIACACPKCGTQYRLPAASLGKRARCRDCQTVFAVTAPEV